MALSYCEVCGALIRGQPAADLPDGQVICDDCFASRRVVVAEEPEAEEARPATVEFGCVYCKSVLRVHAVAQRTKVRCPKCSETFFMNPDGSIEARLEGNTTAIIAKPEGLDPLTPAGGTPEKAGKFTRLAMDNTKTQPLKRPTGALALPIEALDPPDDDDEPSEPLELLPPDVGPGEVAPDEDPALHASDEGRLDLDAEGLKRKTARFQQQQKKANTRRLPRDGVLAEPAKEPEADPQDEARRAERAAREQERAERAAAAQRKAAALEATATRRALAAGALWLFMGLPLIALALVVSMTSRGEGFAVRGQVGEGLERVGRTVETGAKAVNDLLPASLRPATSEGTSGASAPPP